MIVCLPLLLLSELQRRERGGRARWKRGGGSEGPCRPCLIYGSNRWVVFPCHLFVPSSTLDQDFAMGRGARRVHRRLISWLQSYLLSLRPFLNPSRRLTPSHAQSSSEASKASASLVKSADEDRVFRWDQALEVNWSMVIYVTIRDQVSSHIQRVAPK